MIERKAKQIDSAVNKYFAINPILVQLAADELLPFLRHQKINSIKSVTAFIRELEKKNKLHLLPSLGAKEKNKQWYFSRLLFK